MYQSECVQMRNGLATIAVLMLLGMAGSHEGRAQNTELVERQRELADLEQRIQGISSTLRETTRERDAQSEVLRKAEQRSAIAFQAVREIDLQLQRIAQRRSDLETRRAEALERLAQQKAVLARQVRSAYLLGRQEHIKLLLNQQNPAKVGRALRYYEYLNQYRGRQISGVLDQLTRLQVLESGIQAQAEQARDARQRRGLELSELERALDARQRAMTVIEARLGKGSAELERLREDRQMLQSLVEQLQVALRGAGTVRRGDRFDSYKGALPWPVSGRIAARYGAPRRFGDLRWRGLLVETDVGQPVRAVAPGRIVFSDWLRGFGLLLIIDHGGDYLTIYAHNQVLYRRAGDEVGAGDVVAGVGNSGGSARAGLYFEIRHRGKPVDPEPWLDRRQSG